MTLLASLLPLLAAMVYSIAALFLNAAGRQGVKGLHATAVCNLFLGLFMLVFYDWTAFPAIGEPVWPIVILSFLFLLGQALTILAFSLGEVSIVAPVMGLKVILVNIMVAIGLREPLAGRIWLAGFLAVAGIYILQSNPGKQKHPPRSLLAMLLAFFSAAFFGAADVFIQHWTPMLGFERFLPPSMLLAAVLSLFLFVPGGGLPPRRSLKLLLPGGFLLALQSLLLIYAIAVFGRVAEANILYSSRGVWSVLSVWWLGHHFTNLELRHGDRSRLFRRLAGSVLITVAILITLLA